MLLIGLLVALGATVTSALLSGGGSGGSVAAQDMDLTEFDDSDQIIAAQDSQGPVTSLLAFLEAEGVLTPEEADIALDETIVVDGPIRVATGGGDDVILAGAARDYIDAGAGDDTAFGGAGDDTIQLGDGNDMAGLLVTDDAGSLADAGVTAEALAVLGAGDDDIRGGRGDDMIADAYGENRLAGNQGSDVINAVDADGVTPDHVLGGYGHDVLVVDQGDTVETGGGNDRVVIDVEAGFGDGYDVVTIFDFDPSRDVLELESGVVDLIELPDGSGSEVTLNGVPIVRLAGVLGLSADELAIVG